MQEIFLLICFSILLSTILSDTEISYRRHLVVLSHGIIGNSHDLSFLGDELERNGFLVLRSKSNELHKSFSGIVKGASNLCEEIAIMKAAHPDVQRISFVGNSLGGLYARAAIKQIYDPISQCCMGLVPDLFMTIATPHLGVRHHTFLDEVGIKVPLSFKRGISCLLGRSIKNLFGMDGMGFNHSLIFDMATTPIFLDPLRAFRHRRLYANIENDLVVPLGTAAILPKDVVRGIRRRHREDTGIVAILRTREDESLYSIPSLKKQTKKEEILLHTMISRLNEVGWEKVLVHFPGQFPTAHNKICAMTKFGPFIDQLLGFEEGRPIMNDAVSWFLEKAE